MSNPYFDLTSLNNKQEIIIKDESQAAPCNYKI